MSDMNTDTIYLLAHQYGIALPPAVTEAHAVLEAAETLRDKIAAETEPQISDLTRKNLDATHAALVAWENRGARLRAAETLVTTANQAHETAKFVHSQELAEPLAETFNKAAARFTKAHAELGGDIDQTNALRSPERSDSWRNLSESASDLQRLKEARTAYAPQNNRAALGDDQLEEMTRIAVVPSIVELRRSAKPRDIAGWAELVDRGFVLRWQTRTEQEANANTLRRTKVSARA